MSKTGALLALLVGLILAAPGSASAGSSTDAALALPISANAVSSFKPVTSTAWLSSAQRLPRRPLRRMR
jgi:hypothetical protein